MHVMSYLITACPSCARSPSGPNPIAGHFIDAPAAITLAQFTIVRILVSSAHSLQSPFLVIEGAIPKQI